MNLVELIQYRCFWILAHACSSHFVNAKSGTTVIVAGFDVLHAGSFKHFSCIVHHIFSHLPFILLQFHIKSERRQSILVAFVFVERNTVLLIRKEFSETSHAKRPHPRCHRSFFQLLTNRILSDHARPALTAAATLVTKATQIITFVFANISVSRDVKSISTSSRVVLVFHPWQLTICSCVEVVVHDVATELIAVVSESVGETA